MNTRSARRRRGLEARRSSLSATAPARAEHPQDDAAEVDYAAQVDDAAEADDAAQIDDTAQLDETAEVARYIADMTAQLGAMARAAGLDLLAYFLAMANAESETEARAGAKSEPSSRR
jgi:hypothetical protein